MSIDTRIIKSVSDEEWTFLRLSQQLGEIETKKENMIIFKDDRFIYSEMQYSQQSQKLFEEIIQNAIDNYIKHPTKGYQIVVNTESRTFSVQNNGFLFQLNGEDDSDISRVFSVQRTSDQYDSEIKQTAGMNGLGAKLVNQCAKVFQIQVHNNGFKYIATWKDCKKQFSEKHGKSEEKFFKVIVTMVDVGTVVAVQSKKIKLDFCDLNQDLILKYMIDLQICYPEIQFKLNGNCVPKLTLDEFLEMNNITDFVIEKYKDLHVCLFKQISQSKDIDAPLFRRYTMINGIQTFLNEGSHYDSMQAQLKKLTKVQNLSIGMFFIGRFQGIDYGEQVKTKIIKMQEIIPTQKLIDFVKRIDSEKDIKRDNKIKFNKKLIEANNVKSKKSNCTLILTEGDSASCLFKSIQSSQPKFFDNYGLFPLKGKIQGVEKMDDELSQNMNAEIKNIISIVGLKKINYDEENIKTLRYQKILIATDYDVDGYHICGLIMSFIYKYWPSLIELKFLQRFTTPIITARDGQKEIEFFSLDTFKQYQNKLTHVSYYKGLGSFTKQQAAQMGKQFNKYIKDIVPEDKNYGRLIQQLFTGDADQRKALMLKYQYQDIDYSAPQIKVKQCMNQVLEYAVDSVQRAIPSFGDGLKQSQRKIIYWMLQHRSIDKIKVSQLSGKVSGDLDYHHGEISLQGATIILAQDFAGSNNCNLLQPEGQFGDRQNPQSYGSPRYIFVKRSKWLDKIYMKDDQLLYVYNKSDDDENIEPENLYPIIPIQMVNGANGIATGWRTYMPCYKLEDIVHYIFQRLDQQETQQLVPYYNNYQGTIEIVREKLKQSDKEPVNKMKCTGSFVYDENTKDLQIYDTTIDSSISDLEQFLKSDTIKQEHIKNEGILIKNISTELLNKIFRKFLVSKQALTYMRFVDGTTIKDYQDANVFLNEWIDMRYKIYVQRKQKVLIELLKQYIIYYNYNRFLEENIQQYLSSNKFKDILDQKLSYFTPQSYIDNLNESRIEVIMADLQKRKTEVQSDNAAEYNYIKQKSINYFNNYDMNKLKQIEEEYKIYLSKKVKQIWKDELTELLK